MTDIGTVLHNRRNSRYNPEFGGVDQKRAYVFGVVGSGSVHPEWTLSGTHRATTYL